MTLCWKCVLLLSSILVLILPREGTDGFLSRAIIPHACRSQRDTAIEPDLPTRTVDSTVALSSTQTSNPSDELSDERKANLFQFLLRDLEVEGAPLLDCDAILNETLQAALWTTMAELSESDERGKVCLVFERIPIHTLRTVVQSFDVLKSEQRLMDHLPELNRFSMYLVGKGIGPAIVIETANRTETEKVAYEDLKQNSAVADALRWTAAMKTFVARMTLGLGIDLLLTGSNDVPTGPAYRNVGSPDVCDVLAGFWNSICELLVVPDDEMNSVIVSFPLSLRESEEASHARFAAETNLISRTLHLLEGKETFDVLYMHPFYERDAIQPSNDHAHGHIPPTSWLRQQIQKDADEDLSDEELALHNFQRRSPLPSVAIKRNSVCTFRGQYFGLNLMCRYTPTDVRTFFSPCIAGG